MTAEEKLKEHKEKWLNRDELKVYPARLAPQGIDLIANLVIERLNKKEEHNGETNL